MWKELESGYTLVVGQSWKYNDVSSSGSNDYALASKIRVGLGN